MKTSLVVLFIVWIAAGCTKEYEFPDHVPKSSTRWVDAPLKEGIDAKSAELAGAIRASYPVLSSLACADAEGRALESAVAQSMHSVAFAATQGNQALQWGRTVEEVEAAAAQPAPDWIAAQGSVAATCRQNPVPEPCVASAARETADLVFASRVRDMVPSRQSEILDLLAREYTHEVRAVESSGTLVGARETIVAACDDSPLVQALATASAKERPRRPAEDAMQILSAMAGGAPMMCAFTGAWFEEVTRNFDSALNKRADGEVGCGEP